MTLKSKFPYLFANYVLDEGGRPVSAPTKDNPNALAIASARTPTAIEVVIATMSEFGYPINSAVAGAVVNDLKEYLTLTTSAAVPASAPPTPPSPATPSAATPTGA